jgi:hypothetical protein
VSASTWVTGGFCRRHLPKYVILIIITAAFKYFPSCLLICFTHNSLFL